MSINVDLSDEEIEVIKYCIEIADYNGLLSDEQKEKADNLLRMIAKIDLNDFTLVKPGPSALERWEKRIVKDD